MNEDAMKKLDSTKAPLLESRVRVHALKRVARDLVSVPVSKEAGEPSGQGVKGRASSTTLFFKPRCELNRINSGDNLIKSSYSLAGCCQS